MRKELKENLLSKDRTRLANERTLLAYLRTSLAFLILGSVMIRLNGTKGLFLGGVIAVVSGIGLFVYGVIRFRKYKKKIENL